MLPVPAFFSTCNFYNILTTPPPTTFFDLLYLVMGLCLPGNGGEAVAFGTLNPPKNQHGDNGWKLYWGKRWYSKLKFHIFRVGACTSCRNSLGNTPDLWLAQGAHPHIPFSFASSSLFLCLSLCSNRLKIGWGIEIKRNWQGQKEKTLKPLLCRSTRVYATLGWA